MMFLFRLVFDQYSIFTEIPTHRKKITETEITEPKSYRTRLLTNSMFLKWNFVWKHVENISEDLIDQIGCKNIEIQHFYHFSKITKK